MASSTYVLSLSAIVRCGHHADACLLACSSEAGWARLAEACSQGNLSDVQSILASMPEEQRVAVLKDLDPSGVSCSAFARKGMHVEHLLGRVGACCTRQ